MATPPMTSLYFDKDITLNDLVVNSSPYYRRYRDLREEYENEKENQFRNINAKDTLEDYNAKIIESRQMIELLENATDAQLEEYMVTQKAEEAKYLEEQIEKKSELMDRYIAMLKQVEEEISDEEFRDYLIEQLNTSMNQDCISVVEKQLLPKIQHSETVAEYRDRMLSREKATISRYEHLIKDAVKRNDSTRVNKLAELLESDE